MTLRALVPGHFHTELAERVRSLDVELIPYDKDGTPLRSALEATVLFRWWISAEQGDALIQACPLRWIHTGSAGVDHILTPVFRERKILLTNSSGVHSPSIAEWVVLGVLAQEKGLAALIQQQRDRLFEKVQRDELQGKHVILLGGGHIASQIAMRLRPFGVRITTMRRTREESPLYDRVTTIEDLDALRDADWLIIALPLTAKTQRLVDREFLSCLPNRCRIVNVARGEIVDEPELIEALTEGRVAGAVLDVFEREPLPSDHPFWSMENVIVLPHTTWRSPQVQERQISLFVENLGKFVRSEPLLNVVDVDAGY